MELWSEIRRRVLTGEMSKREACGVYEIHWATLKKILAHEEPPGYRRSRIPRRPTVEPVLPISASTASTVMMRFMVGSSLRESGSRVSLEVPSSHKGRHGESTRTVNSARRRVGA